MPIDDRTTNFNLPLPNIGNTLDVDVGRLRDALSGLDAGLQSAVVDLSDLDAELKSAVVDLLVDIAAKVPRTSASGSAVLPSGTQAQRDAEPVPGSIRFNSEIQRFEGFDGVRWGAIAGDSAIHGVFYENDQIIDTDHEIPTGKNAMSAGPVEIGVGITISIPDGSVWTIV
ncbi:MAG: hypothetical protein IBX56_15285 [Methylomicrobium sp.]|nr:hypothetical protein [Methylomicrobium sp.]